MQINGLYLSSSDFDFQEQVLDHYNSRAGEIEEFFGLMDKFEAINPAKIIAIEDHINTIVEADLRIGSTDNVDDIVRNVIAKLSPITLSTDLSNIFKSSAVLLLYNFIESTVSKANECILKRINAENMLYSEASETIKKIWVENKSKKNKLDIIKIIKLLEQPLKIDIDYERNEDAKEFQGDLDPRNIDALLTKYGVQTTHNKIIETDPAKMQMRDVVKDIVNGRNKLAHGEKSFVEYGRTLIYSTNSTNNEDRKKAVLFQKESCFFLMQVFLENIEDYIITKGFKISP